MRKGTHSRGVRDNTASRASNGFLLEKKVVPTRSVSGIYIEDVASARRPLPPQPMRSVPTTVHNADHASMTFGVAISRGSRCC